MGLPMTKFEEDLTAALGRSMDREAKLQEKLREAKRENKRLRETCEKIIAMSDGVEPNDSWGPGFRGYHAALRDIGLMLRAELNTPEPIGKAEKQD